MTRRAETPTGEIIVVLESGERRYSYDQLGLTFESEDQVVMDALQPLILEETGINIREEDNENLYTIRRVEETHNLFCFPKSPAGN